LFQNFIGLTSCSCQLAGSLQSFDDIHVTNRRLGACGAGHGPSHL
jgi:hypothetical protein